VRVEEERAAKMSRVEERRRENWSGVRRGMLCGWEGKIVMWRGLFWQLISKGSRRIR